MRMEGKGREREGGGGGGVGGFHGMISRSFLCLLACLITNQIHHLPLFTKRSALSSCHRNRNVILLFIVLYPTQKLNHTTSTTLLISILPLIRQR